MDGMSKIIRLLVENDKNKIESLMAKHYQISERSFVEVDGHKRPICPACKEHKQLTNKDEEWYELQECDCKNTFYELDEQGKQVCKGQCCCYSTEHMR